MELVVVGVVVGIVALIAGYLFGFKVHAAAVAPKLREISRTQAIDQARYLQTLRREIANILIWRNPERYLELYERLHAEVTSFKSWSAKAVTGQFAALCEKYPEFGDFDVVSVRDYVLYADSTCFTDDQELEERYRDIVRFAALALIANKSWQSAGPFISTTSDEELEHLTKYVQKVIDTQLQLRLKRAIEHSDIRSEASGNHLRYYECDAYSIFSLPITGPDTRYGIAIKRTKEFGTYSLLSDKGKVYKSYCRSDPMFEVKEPLRIIHNVSDELASTTSL